MSFGFLGIQFGFELQNSNVSRIFETLGANANEIPILWIAAPLTGLLVQPIIGYLSDRTWHHTFGRRRPFFLIGAILSTLALFVMPNSPALWVAGGMLWIMDASFNISMEPFRAFVGDMLPEEQRTKGFAMQSFFIGIGSVIAASLPWMLTNWFKVSNIAGAGQIPDSVKWAFYLGAIILFISVLYTVLTTKEYPPADMAAFEKEKAEGDFFSGIKESVLGIFQMPKTMKQLAIVQFFSWFALFAMWIYTNNAVTTHLYDTKIDRTLYSKLESRMNNLMKEPNLDAGKEKELASLKGNFEEINRFQKEGEKVALAVNIANYFATDSSLAETEKTALIHVQKEFNNGGDWLGLCSSVRNLVAAIFAFLLPIIARRLNRRRTHLLCLIIGGLGLASLELITNPAMIALSMGMVGIAWASILSMPYAILTGSLPENKMGYFMGVFNFFIVIPQIVAATILGFFTNTLFNGNTLHTVLLGGISMMIAGVLCLQVEDKDSADKVISQ